ncbi:hypothetical protein TNCV_4802711 [Trichonephila clavipes]|nr:hypothetical protein TNCV_4802711 [Trichonephila clavipes]
MNRWSLPTITLQPKCLSKASRLGLDIKYGCCVPAVAILTLYENLWKKPGTRNSPLGSRAEVPKLFSVP